MGEALFYATMCKWNMWVLNIDVSMCAEHAGIWYAWNEHSAVWNLPHFGDKIHSTLILNPYLLLILGNMASIIPKMLLALNQSIELILEIQSRVIPLSHQILNYINTKSCYSGITHRSKLTHSFSNVCIYFFSQYKPFSLEF